MIDRLRSWYKSSGHTGIKTNSFMMGSKREENNSKPLLGEFIRAHRERISPEAIGLARGLRRRVKGLRREELAQLCEISPTWLTWIEQGRAVLLSTRTLSRLAAALRLAPAARAYLFDLAGLRDPQAHASVSDTFAKSPLHEALAGVLSNIKTPAYVLDHAWNAVDWNRQAAQLFVGWLGKRESERNLLNYTFLNVQARVFIDDWPTRARRLVAEFRADRSASLQDVATRLQVEALRQASADFNRMWREQDVLEREGGERVFLHPTRGRLSYRQLTFRVAQALDLKLVVLV
jgi:transcriptional regulator with XRE-family HTH domain